MWFILTNISDNSVNIIINDKYDGLITLNELTWLKKPPHPSKIININDEIEALVLDIDDDKKRVNCSLKQMKENPWTKLKEKFNINDIKEAINAASAFNRDGKILVTTSKA